MVCARVGGCESARGARYCERPCPCGWIRWPFDNPPLEAIQRARQGFSRQPPTNAAATGRRSRPSLCAEGVVCRDDATVIPSRRKQSSTRPLSSVLLLDLPSHRPRDHRRSFHCVPRSLSRRLRRACPPPSGWHIPTAWLGSPANFTLSSSGWPCRRCSTCPGPAAALRCCARRPSSGRLRRPETASAGSAPGRRWKLPQTSSAVCSPSTRRSCA